MNVLQRGVRSVLRKPIKSIILLFIVIVMSGLFLGAMASRSASIYTQDATRQAIGATFRIEGNEENRRKRLDQAMDVLGDREGSYGGVTHKWLENGADMVVTDNSFETVKEGNIVLEAKNVVYYYKANKGKKVLDDISYGFEIGKMYAILGPSGSGKTTFLSLLAGLDSPTDGGIYYEGVNIRKKGLHNYRKKNMSLVFQNYNLIDYLTPEENVMLGGKKDIEKILEAVGIPREDWKRQVLQLSGGQQQRVAIARALASPAKVLLADEPTGNLDEEIADEIIKILMKSAHEMGKSVIVVTHSKKIADAADVVLKIHEGKLYHLV